MKLENIIINRNSYERIGKEQKSYIIECYQNSKMSISKMKKKTSIGILYCILNHKGI